MSVSKRELAAYLGEVEKELAKLTAVVKPPKWKAENYVGAGVSRYRYLEVKIPVVRARLKRGFSFADLPLPDQWKIWDYIWKNAVTWEAAFGAIVFAEKHSTDILQANAKLLFRWADRLDNWAHSDGLSAIYSRLLEHRRPDHLPTIERWAVSREPWHRRQSLVALLYYSRFRDPKRALPFSKISAFIDRQIDHEHYYVQKGVGWVIREAYNLYPRETLRWLRSSAARVAPPAWTAATEKLPAGEKRALMAKRKAARGG